MHCIDDMDPGTHQPVMTWDLSPSGDLLATGAADFSTKVYSVSSGMRIVRLSPLLKSKYNSAEGLVFSSDGSQLASVIGKKIELFDSATWTLTHTLKGHISKITDIQFSHHGPFLATVGGKQLRYWDTSSGREICSFTAHDKMIYSCDFAASGELVATAASDQTVRLWTFPSGELLGAYQGHTGKVFYARFSCDAKWIASWQLNSRVEDWKCPADGELHLWNSTTYEVVLRLPGYCKDFRFSPEGRWLGMAPENGEVMIIEMSTGEIRYRLPPSQLLAFSPLESGVLTAEGNDLVFWRL